jgi:serine/threonine-protein kinase
MSGSRAEETVVEGLPGERAAFSLGKYQLFASLGRGGMADVFLAVAHGPMGFNKLVVIKRLRPALAEEPVFRNMFLDEARLAARLNHANVVHTYEVGEHEGIYFIAMEYLEGQSLNKVTKEGVKRGAMLDPALSVRVIADALAGLGYAHELRDYDGRPLDVVHRDVSPQNVFVGYDGHVKLVDFGIAKAELLSTTETEAGVLKGKVGYMSPEHALGEPLDARADLFAMGIVLWEMLAHRRLLYADSAAATLQKLMNTPIPRLSSVKPTIDARLDAIVMHALEKDRDRRFQSAREMRDALENWLVWSRQTARQDEVGQRVSALFHKTRDEVDRQIRTHMLAVTAASNTAELKALTAQSLAQYDAAEKGDGELLTLGTGGGSGSGIVSTFPMPRGAMPMSAPPPVAPMPPSSRRTIVSGGLVVIAFVVAAMMIVGLTPRRIRPLPTIEAVPPTSVARAEPTSQERLSPASPSDSTPAPLLSAAADKTEPVPVASLAPARRDHTRTTRDRAAASASASAPGTEPGSHGFLSLTTYPWTRVSEGGRVLGNTPLYKVPLSPGDHALTLENPDLGIKQATTVTIKSGEVTAKKLGFE